MYYKTIDNKKDKWIVLIHCICSNMQIFDDYIPSLSEKYNILMINLPGHGRSKKSTKNIDFKANANDICKIISRLNIKKFDIWSISLGTIITKYMIQIIPNKIEKVYFEAPAFGIENKFLFVLFYIFNKIKIIIPKRVYIKLFIYSLLMGRKRKHIRKLMYEHSKNTNKYAVAMYLDKMLEEFILKDYKILNKSKIYKEYIIGEKDYVFKGTILKNIEKSKYNKIRLIKNAGHLCHIEESIISIV